MDFEAWPNDMCTRVLAGFSERGVPLGKMMLGSSPILPLPAPPSDGNLGPLPPAQVAEESTDIIMDESEEDQNKSQKSSSTPASVATHTRTIGIIHPPPDIRTIVDKTAQFVAKNGPEFEKRIIINNAGNAKFNFLTASDPYHAYYQHRLSEARAQNQASGEPASEPTDSDPSDAPVTAESGGKNASARPDPSAQFRIERKVLEPPEVEQYTVRLPEGITGEELDIIKLTAQFVARNGRSFLTGLTSREMNNPQFHFLKPTHSMFMFFTSLADAYSKVLMPPNDLKNKLEKSVTDLTTVLERCIHRLEWEKSQEQARQKAEDEIEQERLLMAMIDWHDFVVVESIDFADDEDDDLPPPMTLEEVIHRSKISAGVQQEEIVETGGKEVEMEMDEEEVQLVEDGMRAASLDENGDSKKHNDDAKVVVEEQEPPMRIVKNWKRPEERLPAERDPTKYVVSPITGEVILVSEMSEHMRISLIDPKYKEQKERMFAKIRETTLAHDDEISRNIVGLARTRPDIFGTTEEEVSNAVKAEIEKKKDEQPKQVIWDGHSGSIGWTANQAMSHTGEDQNEALNNEMRNFPGPPRPGMPSIRPLPPPPGLTLNIPRPPPNSVQYSAPSSGGGGILAPAPPPRPPVVVNMMPAGMRPPPPPMQQIIPGQQPHMLNRPPLGIPVPPPPGSQFTPLAGHHQSFVPHQIPQPGMPLAPPPPMSHGMPPPPPPEEAPPPLPEEPEPKRQKLDDYMLIPEDQFMAQHPGAARINVAVPNHEEGNLKGQVVEITLASLSETVGSLKEKIAGEIQLPANKQKLSGKAGFLKDNLSLAYYNVGPSDTLSLSLRERGGRKR